MKTGSPPRGVAPKHGTDSFTSRRSPSALSEVVAADPLDGEVNAAADPMRSERMESFILFIAVLYTV